MATVAFNKYFMLSFTDFIANSQGKYETEKERQECQKLIDIYEKAYQKGAMFDARCFNIPREEVTNCIYWRQLDATRNSIQMVGQANFSHGELQEKTCNMIQDMLMEQKGINWNDYPVYLRRGTAVIKEEYLTENDSVRTRWIIDLNMPQLKGDDRWYLECLI